MKILVISLAAFILMATSVSPLIASQHGMEEMKQQGTGAGKKTESTMQEEQERMMEQQREMEQEQMMNGEGERHMEQQREMEQTEQGEGAEEGEKKKERKWWRFWE